MENTDDFTPFEFMRNHKKGFSLIILLITAYWLTYHGVTVPASEPFVRFEIVTERETYHLGESIMAHFQIRNMMPFPIRIKIDETMFRKAKHSLDKGWSVSTHGSGKNKPYEVKIEPGHAYLENHGIGPAYTTKLGEYLFNLEYGDQTINHSVSIVD